MLEVNDVTFSSNCKVRIFVFVSKLYSVKMDGEHKLEFLNFAFEDGVGEIPKRYMHDMNN